MRLQEDKRQEQQAIYISMPILLENSEMPVL